MRRVTRPCAWALVLSLDYSARKDTATLDSEAVGIMVLTATADFYVALHANPMQLTVKAHLLDRRLYSVLTLT